MAMHVLTIEDLHQFKIELIAELRQLLKLQPVEPPKQWLKSYEVRKMLGISRGTLQNMRDNGTLTATKIGGLMFYSYEDIVRLLDGKNPPPKR